MTRILGVSLSELDKLGDDFTNRVIMEVRGTLRQVAKNATEPITVDDLAQINTHWTRRVDDVLMRRLEAAYWRGVDVVHLQVAEHAKANRARTAAAKATAASPDGLPNKFPSADIADLEIELGRVSNPVAEAYLSGARNSLVNVGHEVWENARGALLDGMQTGLGVSDLRDAITGATDLSSGRAETIARTEVNGAANAGAVEQMRAIDVPASKTWIATLDARTRPEHADADGQEVGIDETFDIGGESMDRPHDPGASGANVVNCRCTVSFTIPDDYAGDVPVDTSDEEGDLTASALVAAVDGEVQTGAMIALVPTDSDIARLVLADGEPPEELHLTLFFLGEAVDYDEVTRASIVANVRSFFEGVLPIDANVFGADFWAVTDGHAWVLGVGADREVVYDGVNELSVVEAAQLTGAALDACEVSDMMPPQFVPWVPHICLAYSDDTSIIDEVVSRFGPITFDKVRIAFAGEAIDVPLIEAPATVTPEG